MNNLHQPKWLADFTRLMPVRSGFFIAGRPRDLVVVPGAKGLPLVQKNVDALSDCLQRSGIDFLIHFDIVSGMRLEAIGAEKPSLVEIAAALKLPQADAAIYFALTPEVFVQRLLGLEAIQRERSAKPDSPKPRFKYAVNVDYGSRFLQAMPDPTPLAGLVKRCDEAIAVLVNDRAIHCPLVFWVDAISEVPSWAVTASQRIEALTVTAASFDQRRAALESFSSRIQALNGKQPTDSVREQFINELTARSSSLTLTDLDDLTKLSRGVAASSADALVRGYEMGDTSLDNPWRSSALKDRVVAAEEAIKKEILGQDAAIVKAMDILKRAVVGLSGAQASSSPNRPRGVLFLAGPTGTGKTELAKQIAKVVLGDPEAFLRLDMSEYSSEHHEARLVGAPPGYIGHDAGGQLTEGVRAKPFTVVLFDEIEKAHPRILDKFLQILEDGRITDGRGRTAYFSEAILVFTSNMGMSKKDKVSGERVELVHPGMSYAELEPIIRGGIEADFRDEIGRPELLNRFGDNIVVFNFISPDVGKKILDNGIATVAKRLQQERQLTLKVADAARGEIDKYCLSDMRDGGRGIKNKLETVLINPLSRVIAPRDFIDSITVNSITYNNDTLAYTLEAS